MAPAELWWERRAGGARGTAVLLPGLAGSSDDLPPALDDLLVARGLSVVRVDLRDAGRSPRLDDEGVPRLFDLLAGARVAVPYELADMASDVELVFERARIRRALVLGVSLGGMVAQHLALARPDLVGGLIAASSASTPSLTRLVDPAIAATVLQEQWSPTPDASRQRSVGAALRQLAAALGSREWAHELERLSIPVLLLHGSDDRLVRPSAAFETWRRLRQGRLVLVAGVAHGWTAAQWLGVADHIGWVVEEMQW